MKDLMEVGPLSRGAKLEPLSNPLQVGFRFLHHPVPATSSACLAAYLPLLKENLRACLVPYQNHKWVRSRLFAGGTAAVAADP
jgi:hypothetical protein